MGLLSYCKDIRGNIGLMTAIAAIPLFLSAGSAIDLMKRNNSDTILQGATDAAALAGYQAYRKYGRSHSAESKIKDVVFGFLKANSADTSIKNLKIKRYGFDQVKDVFFVEMAGAVPTSFLQLGGIKSLDALAYSEVNASATGLELALVLDTTLSMSRRNRMPTLKRSATKLVNLLFNDKDRDQYLRIGLVPFANYVNVGLANRNQSWMDVPADYQDPPSCYTPTVGVEYGTDCTTTSGVSTNTSCSGGGDGEAPTCSTSTSPYTSTSCNVTNPGYPGAEVCVEGAWHRWHGVVGSRSMDTIVSGGEPYPGPLDFVGPNEITDLTENRGRLISGINTLTPANETYIPTGLLWGWNLLDSNAPFTKAKTQAAMDEIKGYKALILMTDGHTTRSPSGSWHEGTDAALSDAKTAEMCDNIKNDKIVVYTISFMVQKTSTKQMLARCASDEDNVFDAQDDVALEEAFEDIANSLKQLYLSQ